MSWRDFQPSTPIDKIDKRDKLPPVVHIVDIVDIVEREENSKASKRTPPHSFSPVVKPGGSNAVAALPEMKVVWENPFPKGTPEARAESVRLVAAATSGEAKELGTGG